MMPQKKELMIKICAARVVLEKCSRGLPSLGTSEPTGISSLYLPFQLGFRFSAKALGPSTKSSETTARSYSL